MAALAQTLTKQTPLSLADEAMQTMATYLKSSKKALILLGALSREHPQASHIRYWAENIAQSVHTQVSYLSAGANSAGAWLSGAVPHRLAGGQAAPQKGLSAYQMLKNPRQAYILLNVEPDLDCAHPRQAAAAMKQAKCVVSLSSFAHPLLQEHADVILPIAPFTETSGTFVNAQGEWQSFTGVTKPYYATRPAWKVLRVLGNFMQCPGFDYESSEAVREAVREKMENSFNPVKQDFIESSSEQREESSLTRVGEVPLYAIDSLVRRAKPLQEAQQVMDGEIAIILHPETAKHWHLQSGDQVEIRQEEGRAILPLRTEARCSLNTAWIPAGIRETAELDDPFGNVKIVKVN